MIGFDAKLTKYLRGSYLPTYTYFLSSIKVRIHNELSILIGRHNKRIVRRSVWYIS